MSVYLNTFRTESKTALYKGEPVKVFAFRFLCKAQDVDNWGNPWGRKAANMLRLQCERAQERFDRIKPAFAVQAFENQWEGIVYASLKGACHYDDGAEVGEPVGFLRQLPGGHRSNGGWVITGERHGEDSPMVCGLTVRRAYVERVAVGVPYSLTVKSYRFSNGTVFTPEQFEAWRDAETPKYLAACKAAQEEQARKESEAAQARAIQAKRDKVNADIQAARDTLARLEQERAAIC